MFMRAAVYDWDQIGLDQEVHNPHPFTYADCPPRSCGPMIQVGEVTLSIQKILVEKQGKMDDWLALYRIKHPGRRSGQGFTCNCWLRLAAARSSMVYTYAQ